MSNEQNQPAIQAYQPPSDFGPASITTSHYIWVVVMLLWPVALLNYLDRQMMAAMKASIMHDIPSIAIETNWGLLLGCFKWVYAGLSPFGGYFADKFSRRWIIAVSLLVWSGVTWLTAHVTSFEQLLWTRSLMGISEACYIPAALALIADFHSKLTRSRAIGIHQTAIYAGLILGGFSGYAAESPNFGWRMAFTVAGMVGVAYAFPLWYWLRDAPKQPQFESTANPNVTANATSVPRSAARVSELLGSVSFYLLVAYFTLPAIAGWVVKDWMPEILRTRFTLGQGLAGVSAALYVNLAALGGAFLGGWLADLRMRTSVRGRIQVSAAGMLMIVPALLGIGYAPTLTVAVLFLILFGLGWGFFDCNNMPILSQIARPELRATGYGIMNFVSISCGGFADLIYGVCRDQKLGDHVFFGVVAVATLFSAGLVLLIKPRPELG
ncbi:MAG: MFS transporter [Pirellulaceae bacterium]|nr:MFS transporter [Pirellulaceae bacterium]